jgi:hypothetical protein
MVSFWILNVNAQTENINSEYSLSISKDTTSGLIVTDGATYVNGFDTTYTYKGTKFDYDKARDLVVSAIADDFTNSSTSGYVKVEDTSSSSSNATGLENPFASKEQINEKVKSVLKSAIDSIFSESGVPFTIGPETYVIKCTFGDTLDSFECSKVGGFKLF